MINGGWTWLLVLPAALLVAAALACLRARQLVGLPREAMPGYSWESTGPSILLGYAYIAPGDASGIPARIVRLWRTNRNTQGDVDAWMSANANNRAWNACAIVKGQKYVYFKLSFKGVFKKKVEVPKEDW